MKRIGLIITLLLVAVLAIVYFYRANQSTLLPTYFEYTDEELASIESLQSAQSMTEASLNKWDKLMFDLVKSNKLGDAPASKIYAYVFTAQRDAAFLSYNAKQEFMGSLDVVSARVLCLFFKQDCSTIQFQIKTDPYSEKIAELVVSKIVKRMDIDRKMEKLSAEKRGTLFWKGTAPYFGQETGSWKTWVISSPSQYVSKSPPKPDSAEWQNQLKQTEKALKNISPEQTKAVVFWAGNPSTITPPGIWLKFANEYMESEQVSFSKMLLVRSVLAMGIADEVITLFYTKYTYWIRRPFMLDPSINTVMPTPNHPSYPAGHSGISATAAVILSYYFPENKKMWWKKANEASSSRVWGGIHFPIDAQQGLVMGQQVGEAVIKSQSKSLRIK
ncbi:PAP2 superfamily protein [Legionella quinlivanii]|uniref:PAP2 superfamily protein n=1 Tax=Legionella quinlivanii TaxID=45073 RepID=A0A0W0XLL1_9GAMM|nr:vanadium-dependent haloperoxidase [Legionella quinlivanii]KTD45468.1 PAP2 superfamily protein [Legionella quinlivanii]SEG32970.1 PAP2 superfamily protein [Legionella quinlivanii DSM 21216]STY10559.1 PAP2 superfamily [Legionella quinlivanii]